MSPMIEVPHFISSLPHFASHPALAALPSMPGSDAKGIPLPVSAAVYAAFRELRAQVKVDDSVSWSDKNLTEAFCCMVGEEIRQTWIDDSIKWLNTAVSDIRKRLDDIDKRSTNRARRALGLPLLPVRRYGKDFPADMPEITSADELEGLSVPQLKCILGYHLRLSGEEVPGESVEVLLPAVRIVLELD